MPTPSPTGGGSNKPRKGFSFSLWWMYAIVFLFLAGIFYFDNNSVNKQVTYSQFEQYIEQDKGITKIVVYTDKKLVEGFLTDSLAKEVFRGSGYEAGKGVKASVEANIPSADKLSEKIDQWREQGLFTGDVEYEQSSPLGNALWSLLPFVFFIGVWIYIMRRMSNGGAGRCRRCRRHIQRGQVEGHALRQGQRRQSDLPRRSRP